MGRDSLKSRIISRYNLKWLGLCSFLIGERIQKEEYIWEVKNWGHFRTSIIWMNMTFRTQVSKWVLLLFSHKVMSNSLQPYGLQHIRFLCPPLCPEVWSNSCPLSRWCYLTTPSSAAPFSSCLQSFPASWSFPVSQLFTSGEPTKFWRLTLASILPMNFQGWFPTLTGLILPSRWLSRVCSSTAIQKH